MQAAVRAEAAKVARLQARLETANCRERARLEGVSQTEREVKRPRLACSVRMLHTPCPGVQALHRPAASHLTHGHVTTWGSDTTHSLC